MTQHYDVAVIGTQTAGLIAAALLAKREHRVIVLDHGENIRFYRHHGIHLPLTPTLIPSFEGSPPIKQVHDELGISPELRNAVVLQEPSFQAVMPEHRIDIVGRRPAFLEELRYEFPELVEPVRRFFERLFERDEEIGQLLSDPGPFPPNGWKERIGLSRKRNAFSRFSAPFEESEMLEGIPENHPVRDLLLGPLTFFGHLNPTTPSSLHAIRLIARYFRGSLTFKDRIGGLHGLLQNAAEDSGATIKHGALVHAMETSGRNVTRIVTNTDRPVSADYVIYNALAPLEELLPAGKTNAKVTLESQLVRPVGSLLVCNMVVQRDVIPCGMAEALFLLNGRRSRRAEEPRDAPIFMRRYPAQHGEAIRSRGLRPTVDPNREVLSVALPIRTKEVTHSPERLAALREQLSQRVRRLLPFLDQHLVDTSFPSETSSWDLEGEGVVRAVDPWLLHPLYEVSEQPWLGVAGRANRGFVKNLIYASRDVLPGLGLEGEYLTALKAVETVSTLSKR
ncbi:MAG: NAD(P)-binding protein [Myxococcota bacterium]